MSRKLEFVERAVMPGAKLTALCREFGITPPTGRKWRQRYLELGAAGLEEESRRPKTSPLSIAEELVAVVLEARDAHPSWGPKKIHDLLRRRFKEKTPSQSTVARLLRRFGRIQKRRARSIVSVIEKAPHASAEKPNELWSVDFKGWWRTHDGERCEPLTVRDAHSRFLLAVILTRPTVAAAVPIFEALFRKYGLPSAIQCDNGTPFIHVRARAGLSRLSAWWVSLGIRIVRSRPGCPQDNGGHERMHRDLARDVEAHPASSVAAQQRLIDRWRQEFNHVRPHDALEGKTPAEVYRRSERAFRGPISFGYPKHFVVATVFSDGHALLAGERYYVGAALAGLQIAFEQLDELRCRIWFHQIDCGSIEVLPRWIDDLLPLQTQWPRRHRRTTATQPDTEANAARELELTSATGEVHARVS